MAEKENLQNGLNDCFKQFPGTNVSKEHFDVALSDTHRSVSEKSEEMYKKMQNFMKND